MMRQAKHNRALTLIELVVSLAIVSMLMVAVMTVIGGLSRSERRDQAQHEGNRLASPLRDILANDLVHATQFTSTPDGCQLRTYAAIDPATMERNHRPVGIEYLVQIIAQRRWLVRVQHDENGGPDVRQLVCCDVAHFAVQPADSVTTGTEPADDALPAAFVATVEFTSSGSETFRCTIRRD